MSSNNANPQSTKDDPATDPNSFHNFHEARRGPKGVPLTVKPTSQEPSVPKNPGHTWADTKSISFEFYDQRTSNAPFGYEHFVSLPPAYGKEPGRSWPLILFLHGSGESQKLENESYLSIRHGIPKAILCYDKSKAEPGTQSPSISIPRAERFNKNKQDRESDRSVEPMSAEVCTLLAENFITVTPSLNMTNGYGWNASILSALLDEIVERYRVDLDRIHLTGFSMGGYGAWSLCMHSPARFATLMPICGGGDPLRVSLITHMPHWVHHGELDDVVPVTASTQMVEALQKSGAPSVVYTVYPDTKHDSWTDAYNNLEVYRWMLSTKRTQKGEERVVPEENTVTLI